MDHLLVHLEHHLGRLDPYLLVRLDLLDPLDHPVRRAVHLPGTVESPSASVVASEAEGLVVGMEVREGDRVEKGQILVRLRKITLELLLQRETARHREAVARRDLAQSKLKRANELFSQEVISQDELDDAVSEADAWDARIGQAEAEIRRRAWAVLPRCRYG